MGAIVIGIGIAAIILFIIGIPIYNICGDDHLVHVFVFLCGGTICASIAIGLRCPTKFGEWELINETELIALSNNTVTEGGGFVYVAVSGENVYTYRYEISSEFGTDTSIEYETDTISGDVIESEDPNCEKPVLLEYERKAKITIWTFGLGQSETKYVFYVPEGTIQKEVKLN